MSTTTSKGYKKPSTGDRGTYFTDLEYNIDRTNAHIHDGADSEQIPTKNLIKGTQSILAASWVSVAGQAGTYSQDVTLPTGHLTSTILPRFYVNGGPNDGKQVLLSVLHLSPTTMRLFINDNTMAINIIYG